MSLADIVVVIILGVCLILAIRVARKNHCHDCAHCHKKCGGKNYGREFRKVIEDQRDSID